MFGNVIIGHTLDCRHAPIERWLKNYDSQLYIKWNARKNGGMGCWEVRRRPTKKTIVVHYDLPELQLLEAKYVESDLVHHVLDAKVLDWRIPQRIYDMDTFRHKDWVSKREYEGALHVDKQERKSREELKYAIKQHSRIFRDWATEVAKGQNPGKVLNQFRPK